MSEETPKGQTRRLMTRGEKIRILAMVGLLLVIGIIFVCLMDFAELPLPDKDSGRAAPETSSAGKATETEAAAEVGDAATVETDAKPPGAEAPTADTAAKPAKPAADGDGGELPDFKRYPDIDFKKIEVLLADVADGTYSYDEPAFYWLVRDVSRLPADKMKPGEDVVPYAQLMQTPRSWRGKQLTIEGIYVRVKPWIVPVKAAGVKKLYTCFLQAGPGQNVPVATVICLENPLEYLHKGDRVAVRAYFYKVWQYQVNDRVFSSPLLIARRLEFVEAAPKPRLFHLGKGGVPTGLVWMLSILIGAIFILMLAFFVLKFLSQRKANAHRYRTIKRPQLPRKD
ncbi:MAG: hypothetical protein QGD94_07650 [Planctomycetia bacterium]|nr:hypothetical protein [Planctomycetia bacterium]